MNTFADQCLERVEKLKSLQLSKVLDSNDEEFFECLELEERIVLKDVPEMATSGMNLC